MRKERVSLQEQLECQTTALSEVRRGHIVEQEALKRREDRNLKEWRNSLRQLEALHRRVDELVQGHGASADFVAHRSDDISLLEDLEELGRENEKLQRQKQDSLKSVRQVTALHRMLERRVAMARKNLEVARTTVADAKAQLEKSMVFFLRDHYTDGSFGPLRVSVADIIQSNSAALHAEAHLRHLRLQLTEGEDHLAALQTELLATKRDFADSAGAPNVCCASVFLSSDTSEVVVSHHRSEEERALEAQLHEQTVSHAAMKNDLHRLRHERDETTVALYNAWEALALQRGQGSNSALAEEASQLMAEAITLEGKLAWKKSQIRALRSRT